jgi:hypothetical protein
MRVAVLLAAMLVAGCGETAPQADMPARSWEYYVAHPAEIEPMQKICREWSGSSAPAGSQPAVVTTNCRAAAFAKSQIQLTK